MILLQGDNLYKHYGVRPVLDGVGLSIASGDKIGLIGVNGTGKSTLLRILAGLEEADSGQITTSNELVCEYLPQLPDFDEGATVLEQIFRGTSPLMGLLRDYEATLAALTAQPEDTALTERLLALSGQMDAQQAWQLESEAKAILNKLGIHDFGARIATLSGGQRKRVALAGVLIRPCNLLLLDEPTNHLDNDTITYLENHLKAKNCALLMVTHDRYFLDRVTNRILEVDQGRLYQYEGNYAAFLELKTQREAAEGRMQEKAQALYRQELAWMRKGAEARRTKQKARIERFYALEDSLENGQTAAMDMAFVGARLGKKIIEMTDLGKAFGPVVCFQDLSYAVVRDDRIGIVGRNGLGKSTLLNVIAGRDTAFDGTLAIGDTVRIGYYAQDNRALPGEQKVIDYVKERGEYITAADGTKISAARMLERFLFPGPVQYGLISKLSGGEKRRLYLLGVLMADVNVLLLDEPTNDLDIQTLQILEDFLDHFPGPVLAISHDRYFLDRVANRIFAFEGEGRVDIYAGGYSDYEAKRPEQAQPEAAEAKKAEKQPPKPRERTSDRPRFSYKEAREYETIEGDIAALEESIAAIDREMAAASSDFVRLGELMAQKDEAEAALLAKMDRWEYLTTLAEKIAAQEGK